MIQDTMKQPDWRKQNKLDFEERMVRINLQDNCEHKETEQTEMYDGDESYNVTVCKKCGKEIK